MPNSQPSTSKQEQKKSINEKIRQLKQIWIKLSRIKIEKRRLVQDIQKSEEVRADFSIYVEYRQKQLKKWVNNLNTEAIKIEKTIRLELETKLEKIDKHKKELDEHKKNN